nr:biotin/lipoyl-containing protein [Steroidobacter cummioxidans]
MGQYSFKLPDVGEGTAEAEIAEWRVKVGDRVEEDQPLVDMMTDKATVELTSPVAGIVQSIAGKAGEKAAVGSVLVVLETAGGASASESKQTASVEPPAAIAAAAQAEPRRTGTGPVAVATIAPKASGAEASAKAAAAVSRSGGSSANSASGFSRAAEAGTQPRRGERPAASPAVRRRAEELGIKLQFVRGTGPTGRILHADLDAYLAEETGNGGPSRIGHAEPAQGGGNNYLYSKLSGGEDVPVIGLRRQIAERMQAAKRHNFPHFHLCGKRSTLPKLERRTSCSPQRHARQGSAEADPFCRSSCAHSFVCCVSSRR